ncbi:MAG TPA: hypothetical protein VMR81_00075 [Patescibacteria group bacterium]|nr:hypothetical protein [Patescibacteria group bacterium]
MKFRQFIFIVILLVLGLTAYRFMQKKANPITATQTGWWQIQSIDTMKYSRDMAQVGLEDPKFDTTIDQQLKAIAMTGANYVAVGTPYDEKFIPMLTRWVTIARKYNLHVWFRGNFAGWEGWFDMPKISREQHLAMLTEFLARHGDLFENGDLFTPCPECENGGPGDPRQTGDIEGYRLFLTTEYRMSEDSFKQMGKDIKIYDSMNYDVASQVMDPRTTQALGGVVTIDHYVASPDQLVHDVRAIADASGGRVFLGEIGAPIPDINGDMSDAQQAEWLRSALSKLSSMPQVIGINYWVNVGGSTAIWDDQVNPKPAVLAITTFFSPEIITGSVKDQYNNLIANAKVRTMEKAVYTDTSGNFSIPALPTDTLLYISADKYVDKSIKIYDNTKNMDIVIERPTQSSVQSFLDYLRGLLSR